MKTSTIIFIFLVVAGLWWFNSNTSIVPDNFVPGGWTKFDDPVCCYSYGLGAYNVKVSESYDWTEREDCLVPDGWAGGNKEIVAEEINSDNPCVTFD